MPRYFQHLSLKLNLAFLLLWAMWNIFAAGVVSFVILLVFDASTVGLMPGIGLFTGFGFSLAQAMVLALYSKHHQINLFRWVYVTVCLALIGGLLCDPLFTRMNALLDMVDIFYLFSFIALLPAVGQSWLLNKSVRYGWLWLPAWFISLGLYGTLLLIITSLIFDECCISLWMLSYPLLFVLISGVTMLFLINSPRMGKEKRKNEMLTPP